MFGGRSQYMKTARTHNHIYKQPKHTLKDRQPMVMHIYVPQRIAPHPTHTNNHVHTYRVDQYPHAQTPLHQQHIPTHPRMDQQPQSCMHVSMHAYLHAPLAPLGPNTHMCPHTHLNQVTICKHIDDIDITAHEHPPTLMYIPPHQAHGPRPINIKPEQ